MALWLQASLKETYLDKPLQTLYRPVQSPLLQVSGELSRYGGMGTGLESGKSWSPLTSSVQGRKSHLAREPNLLFGFS